MKLAVKVRYSTTPDGYPGSRSTIVIESCSDRTSDVKDLVEGQHPHWYNLQIEGIEHR